MLLFFQDNSTHSGVRNIPGLNNLPSNITSIKNFNKNEGEDLNFLTYGSSAKNLYLILLEDL